MAISSDAVAIPTSLRMSRWAVAAIFGLNGFSFSHWLVRIPDAKAQLALSEQMLGIVLLFAAIGALIAQPLVGWLIGKVGSKRMTSIMLISFCLTVMLPGLATSAPLMMGALLILGACNGGLDVSMNAQAALVEERYGKPIMSSFHGIWSLGGLLGASLSGIIASWGVALNVHLIVVAIVATLIGFVLIRGLIPDSGQQGAGPSFALPPPALLILGLIAFGVLFCEGAISDWSAVYLRESMGLLDGSAASGYILFSLTMAIGRLTGDWLTQRFGPATIIQGGGALVALGMSLAILSNLPLLAIIGFGFVGAGLACAFPLILSAASRTPGINPSTGIAAMATLGYTGFLVGPPLIGTVAEYLSLRVTLGLLVGIGLLMLLIGGTVGRNKPAPSQQ
jgi:MFS family permease